MERQYFLTTEHIMFSYWRPEDISLAKQLWGNESVTKYICASGVFTEADISGRLDKEIENHIKHSVQYWPIFEISTQRLVGCCGLRPYAESQYEIGFHIIPEFWGTGYAKEAALAVINYAFAELGAEKLFAGHNPNNIASRKLLLKLGFIYVRDEFYPPTGLMHPSYELKNPNLS